MSVPNKMSKSIYKNIIGKNTIYIVSYADKKLNNKFKIGSSQSLPYRLESYRTYNDFHYEIIACYVINKNAYETDDLLQMYVDSQYNTDDFYRTYAKYIEINHENAGGGTEWYYNSSGTVAIVKELEIFFKLHNIEYDKLDNKKMTDTITFFKKLKNYNKNVMLGLKEHNKNIEKIIKTRTTKELKEYKTRYKNTLRLKTINQEEDEEKIDFIFYDYQQKTIDKYNGETGILSYTMGLGKTITAQGLIQKLFKLKKIVIGDIIFWITMRTDILKTQARDFEIFKKLFNFNVIDMVSIKEKNILKKMEHYKDDKLNIILINTDSLDKIKILGPKLCIYDECHGISADCVYKYLKEMKASAIPIIGLSATPLKENNVDRIVEIFGDGKNPHFIDIITYPDAVARKLALPLQLKWLENINKKGNKINKEELFATNKNIIKSIINEHRKTIFWVKTREEADDLYNRLNKTFTKINIYKSHSGNDKDSLQIQSYINDETKCALVCINRFKEGSNDKQLSCGIYYSFVESQSAHVFLQQTGRLTRIAERKTKAVFYQLLDNKTREEKISYIINNIIKYIDYLTSNNCDYKIKPRNSNVGQKLEIESSGVTFFDINLDGLKINDIDFNRIWHSVKTRNKQTPMTCEKLVSLFKEHDITNNDKYKTFKVEHGYINGLPDNIFNTFPSFSWNKVDFKNDFYDMEECHDEMYTLNKKFVNKKGKNTFHNLNKRIPNMYPWLYYGMKYKDRFQQFYR